jgi:iron complex outermembrane receptor protein
MRAFSLLRCVVARRRFAPLGAAMLAGALLSPAWSAAGEPDADASAEPAPAPADPAETALAAAAERASGRLVGSVKTENGVPIAGAAVELVELRRRVRTDAEGAFGFDDVPAGPYLVSVQTPRFGQAVRRVEVAADGETRAEIVLELAAHNEYVVVSVRADARSVNELAQPVSVLAGADLQLRSEATLGETLGQLPGVSSTFFGRGASRPVIRGLGGDRVRMLEDGIGAGDASDTSPDHAVSVESTGAEQIEVVRGPATLLYGSSAVGGVVNLLESTIRSTRPDRSLSGGLEASASSVADEWTGRGALAATAGPLVFAGDLFKRNSGDYRIPGFAESAALREAEAAAGEEHEQASGRLPNSALEAEGGSLSATLVGQPGFLGVAFKAYDSLYGIPGGHEHAEEDHEGEGHDDHDDEEHAEGGVRVDLRQRRFDVRGETARPFGAFRAARLRFGATDYEHKELEGDAIGTLFLNDSWEGRLELVHQPFSGLSGSFGAQASNRDFEAIGEEAFVPPTRTRRFALFAFEELGSGAWRPQLGARWERQTAQARGDDPASREFDGVSLSAGVNWLGSNGWGAGLNLSRSVKLPNAEELYSNGPHLATGAFEIGDRGLEQETSLGFEASLRRRKGRLSGQLDVFYNRFDGFIYEAFTGEQQDGLDVARYSQADATFLGGEAQAAIDLVHAGERHLGLDLQADLVRGTLEADDEPLPRIPPFRYGVGLHYREGGWSARIDLRGWAGQERVAGFETPTDGFAFLNASLGYRIVTGRAVVDLLLRGTNLTDSEGRNHVSFLKDEVPLPGRDLRFGVKLTF